MAAGHYSFKEAIERVRTDYNFKASNDFKNELISSLLKNYSIDISVRDETLKKELDDAY